MKKLLILLVCVSLVFSAYSEVNTTNTNYTLYNGDCIKDQHSNNTYCWGIVLQNTTQNISGGEQYTTIDNITVVANSYNDEYNLSEGQSFYDEYSNRTYNCEVYQFNDIIERESGQNYTDATHNRTFVCNYHQYNEVHYANCGDVITYENEDITFIAPACNSTECGCSDITNYSCSECECKQNITYAPDYGQTQTNDVCNITCQAPAYPKINEDYTASYGSFRQWNDFNLTVRGADPCSDKCNLDYRLYEKELPYTDPVKNVSIDVIIDKVICPSYNDTSYALEPNETKQFSDVGLSVMCKERSWEDWLNLFFYNQTSECDENSTIPIWTNETGWTDVCQADLKQLCTPEELMKKNGVYSCMVRVMNDAKKECDEKEQCIQQVNVPEQNLSQKELMDICGFSTLLITIVGGGILAYKKWRFFNSSVPFSKNKNEVR